MKYIDVVAGVGGFRLGMGRAGHECVWSCEIDRWCQAVYEHQFGERPAGDVRLIQPWTIPDFDCLCAGFPCQSFSVAGKRKGFRDPRGTIFYEICRIAEDKRPRLLLLENVKGLLSVDRGETFSVILQELGRIGYGVEWQVLNSKNHGVPQNRERVFIVGHLGGLRGREVFPITKADEVAVGEIKDGPAVQAEVSSAVHSRYGAGYRAHGQKQLISGEKPMIQESRKGKFRVHRNDEKKSEVQGYSFFDPNKAKVMDVVDAHPKNVIVGKKPMMAQLVGDRDKPSVSFYKDVSPTVSANPMSDRVPVVFQEHSFSGKDGKGRGIRTFGGVVPALTQKMETGGHNVPMVLNATNPHSKTEQREYHPDNETRALKRPSGNQESLVIERRHDRHNNVPMVVRPCLTPDRIEKRQHGRRFKENGEPMFSLTGQDIHGIMVNTRIRRLTPRECERPQGFPDDFTKYGINEKGEKVEISDTQRYKMMGNAVTVNVIEFLAGRLPA